MRKGPTSKQLAFANAMVAGMNPSEAYRAAGYSCNMSAASIKREAQSLLRNPNVAPTVERGRIAAAKSAAWSRETAIERLQDVNAAAYCRMMDKGPEIGFQRADSAVFFDSLDRLNRMTINESGSENRPIICMGTCRDCQAVGCERRSASYDGLGSGVRFGR